MYYLLNMDSNLLASVEQLQTAVELIMDPQTPSHLLREASDLCESFKEQSTQCLQCGFIMAAKERSHFVRHFGLQLVEHCVRSRWNSLSAVEKQTLKHSTLQLISTGTLDILTEPSHIKDALSRVVVEVAKREWPQEWPSMIADLNNIYAQGPMQTCLVLMIFLRLVEDVMTLQTVPTQRRRDIVTALTAIMPTLFPCFVQTLHSTLQLYRAKAGGRAEAVLVILSVIDLMVVLVDWINVTLVMEDSGLLLQLLYEMLGLTEDVSLQLAAVELLLAVAGRKGRADDRKPLMILFSEDAMSTLLTVCRVVYDLPVADKNYLLLKKLGLLLASLGNLLCALLGASEDISEPSTFHKYLEALLAYTQHPSPCLASIVQPAWVSLFSHEKICQTEALLKCVLPLLQAVSKSLVKVGFPSTNDCRASEFSRMDFDSDEEFILFFTKLRLESSSVIRCVTTVCPDVAVQLITQSIDEEMNQPPQSDDSTSSLADPGSHLRSAALHWEALSIFLEIVISRAVTSDKVTNVTEAGISLLRRLLLYTSSDPVITSSVLTCISSLSPFISSCLDVIPSVVDGIFATVAFKLPGETRAARSKAVKNVRRHAASMFIKLCRLYAAALLPQFDELHRQVQTVAESDAELSQLEKCTLSEGLILVSNKMNNFEKQESFVREFLEPLKEFWTSDVCRESLRSVESFVSFVGLDKSPVQPGADDPCCINRSQIMLSVNCILAVLRRCAIPDNPDDVIAGGFVDGKTEAGTPIIRNPATRPIMELLDNVLVLARTVNLLWMPDGLSRCHSYFMEAFDMTEAERLLTFGLNETVAASAAAKSPVERMRSFFASVHETSCLIFGIVGQTIGWQFYQTPNLAVTLAGCLLAGLSAQPEHRLRVTSRAFLKQYIHHCPKDLYETAVVPVLAQFCPVLHQRLCSKWQLIGQRYDHSENTETAVDSSALTKELLEENSIHLLTREYIDLIVCLFRDKPTVGPAADVFNDDMMTDDVETVAKQHDDSVGELGLVLLQNNVVLQSVMLTLMTSFSWDENCVKCVGICYPLLKQLMSMNKMTSEDVSMFLSAVLVGLQKHGQHDSIQPVLLTLALNIYELARPVFTDISQVLLQVSSCSVKDLQSFDEMLTPNNKKPLSDKRKRELFKRLVHDVIGVNVGQQFKNQTTFKTLAPLLVRSQRLRPAEPLIDSDSCDVGLCSLFTQQ